MVRKMLLLPGQMELERGTRRVFTGIVFTIAGLLLPGTALSKNVAAISPPVATPALAPMNRAALLNYPKLPAEILDRIQGTKRGAAPLASKLDSNLSEDWALSD